MNVTKTLSAAAFVLITAGCSHGGEQPGGTQAAATTPPAGTSAAVEPPTEAGARAAATDGYDAYAAGDYGGWWDVWTPSAQQVISRADYMRLSTLCRSIAEGVPIKIQKVIVTGSVAKVRWERLGLLVQLDTWPYITGAWRYQPGAEPLADYRLGADRAAAKRRAAGSCA